MVWFNVLKFVAIPKCPLFSCDLECNATATVWFTLIVILFSKCFLIFRINHTVLIYISTFFFAWNQKEREKKTTIFSVRYRFFSLSNWIYDCPFLMPTRKLFAKLQINHFSFAIFFSFKKNCKCYCCSCCCCEYLRCTQKSSGVSFLYFFYLGSVCDGLWKPTDSILYMVWNVHCITLVRCWNWSIDVSFLFCFSFILVVWM